MNVVLTIGRCAPAGSTSVYLDFQRHQVSRGSERVRLWPHAFMMVAAILVSPRRLTNNELVDIAYDDRPDGGPDWAKSNCRNALWHARQRLKVVGIDCRVLMIGSGGYEVIDLWEEKPPRKKKEGKRRRQGNPTDGERYPCQWEL